LLGLLDGQLGRGGNLRHASDGSGARDTLLPKGRR
jgi:hypothetical protein